MNKGGATCVSNNALGHRGLKPLFSTTTICLPHRTKAELEEIRVCTNRTCRRQGAFQTLEVLTALAPPSVSVNSCGCLGICGSGPNIALLPDAVLVSHCGTAARAAQIFSSTDEGDAVRRTLDALYLRQRAQAEIEQANFSLANDLLSQAIDLKPFGGLHIIYRYRSLVRLTVGNYLGALEDAKEALTLAPKYLEGYMCEGDVFMEMEEYDAAKKSYSMCVEIDPSICRSKTFKTRVAKLQEKQKAANVPQDQ
ncbi:hypothetical protein K2173_004817 [Erythroxylum novogranatense]|uniref:Uncharacterized protein n=1 Tax=Erythroxylum novogranatense TaxID=1862640 RepID=A0AAV8SKF0_9ROSI|nr:hypothetical protein K2173_004817 [Erythroxylum novogranatense]